MRPALRPLHEITVLNTRLLLNCLSDLDDETSRRRIDQRTNSAAFIAAHLVDARFYFAKEVGSGLESPFTPHLGSARGIDDVAMLPPLAEIRTEWERAANVLAERFESLSEEEIQAEARVHFPVADRSVVGVLAFMVQHESYHIGQLALLRKHYGLPAMGYG